MAQYRFKDLNDRTINEPYRSPLGLVFDGNEFEKMWPEFLTLRVDGRDLAEYETSSYSSSALDGDVFEDSALKGGEIRVMYRIVASDSDRLRRIYEVINKFLHDHRFGKLSFLDDPGFYYQASYVNNSAPPENDNSPIGTMLFRTYSKHKYAYQAITLKGPSISTETFNAAVRLIGSFTVMATSDSETMAFITSDNKTLTFGPVKASQVYQLEVDLHKIELRENGIRRMDLMTIDSGLDTFSIPINGTVTTDKGIEITAELTELRL